MNPNTIKPTATKVCRRKGRSGFTLLEITLSIMMTAILMLGITLVVQATVNAKISVESEARARRLGPAIMEIIARDLRNAWANGPDADVEIRGSWFVGKSNGGDDNAADEFHFVTSINSYMRYHGVSSDITEVGYYIKPNEAADGDALAGLNTLYRRESFLVDAEPTQGGLGVRLSDRVISFRVRYYEMPRGAVDADGFVDMSKMQEIVTPGSRTERDDWDTEFRLQLPYAVRVTLVLDATPMDAYTRDERRRIAYYETLVKLPSFPRLDQESQLFAIQDLPFQDPDAESDNSPPESPSPENGD